MPLSDDLQNHWLAVQTEIDATRNELLGAGGGATPEFTMAALAAKSVTIWGRMLKLTAQGYQVMADNAAEFAPPGAATKTVTTVEELDNAGNVVKTVRTTTSTEKDE